MRIYLETVYVLQVDDESQLVIGTFKNGPDAYESQRILMDHHDIKCKVMKYPLRDSPLNSIEDILNGYTE